MLQNGLGKLLRAEAASASRVVDLFCGAASVAWFAATDLRKPVAAFDLQEYAVILARAVVGRTEPLNAEDIIGKWITATEQTRSGMEGWEQARELDEQNLNTATWSIQSQELCSSNVAADSSFIWSKYGGHYFSPTQALSFDALLQTLPKDENSRGVCLAAIIMAASQCSASPGHTAQPFKATRTAGRYLREAWERDPLEYASRAVKFLSPLYAAEAGQANVGDANEAAKSLHENDLVFLDPPYSGVHYSRFYHVLETIARGGCGQVEGVGRYPPAAERPNSAYSRRGQSQVAMEDLLTTLAARGCRVVLTFPKNDCSNGLSGDGLEDLANHYFQVTRKMVKTRFSTLGGNITNRAARILANELILVLHPK